MNRFWCAGVLGIFLTATGVSAQVDLQRFERQLEQIKRERESQIGSDIPMGQRALIDFGAYTSYNLFVFNGPSGTSHTLNRFDINLYASLNFDDVHQFYFRGRGFYDMWNDGDNADGDGGELLLERAYYRFDLARYMSAYENKNIDTNLTIIAGRQLAHWANGLTLSQIIDGGVITVGNQWVSLEALAGVTRKETVDFDSSRPDFDDDTQRGFFGGMFRLRPTPEHEFFVYGLVQEDMNDKNFDPDPLAAARAADPMSFFPTLPTRFEYNSFYIGVGASGNIGDNLLYGVEVVYQGGEGLSNSFSSGGVSIAQTFEDISAWAIDLKLDWLFHDDNQSRLSFELLFASGDDDRISTTNTFGGNLTGTDDNAFNGFGLINTGLAFAPSVSNLAMVRVGASTFPLRNHRHFERLQVGANVFAYFKLDENAPIDETTTADSYLGIEPDLFVYWQITSDLTISARYGIFFPGDAIVNDKIRQFIFTGVTLAF